MKTNVRKITAIAALCAVAYIVMFIGRIPITSVDFLKYDPKDVIIVIGGFLFGPLSALIVSAVVSLLEMFTVSTTGPIGLLMNVLSTVAFACPAAFFYKKTRTLWGAIAGLGIGIVLMTAVMILWNYFLTPLYMGIPREAVVQMLLPIFLPFNLLKGGLNGAIAVLLYKPAVIALRKARLVPESKTMSNKTGISAVIILGSLFMIGTIVVLILLLKGII